MVGIINDLAGLVTITKAPIDQSRNNFDVILDILSTSSRIIREGNFTDTQLAQVGGCNGVLSMQCNCGCIYVCKLCSRLLGMYQ